MEKYAVILDELGMNMALMGYRYWLEAINFYINQVEIKHKYFRMGMIYNYIADRYGLNYFSAERSLRTAVQSIPDIHHKLYKKLGVTCKITNTSFLICLIRLAKKENIEE